LLHFGAELGLALAALSRTGISGRNLGHVLVLSVYEIRPLRDAVLFMIKPGRERPGDVLFLKLKQGSMAGFPPDHMPQVSSDLTAALCVPWLAALAGRSPEDLLTPCAAPTGPGRGRHTPGSPERPDVPGFAA